MYKILLRRHDLNKWWCFVNQFIIYKIDEHNYIRLTFNFGIQHCWHKSLSRSEKKWQPLPCKLRVQDLSPQLCYETPGDLGVEHVALGERLPHYQWPKVGLGAAKCMIKKEVFSIFSSAIWPPHNKLGAIIYKTASLTQC